MSTLSARVLYLILASVITLLFAGTGAFYLLNNQQRSQEANIVADNQEVSNQTTPEPQTSSQPEPAFAETPASTASATINTAAENTINWEAPDPASTATPSAIPSAAPSKSANPLKCNETCNYSYQCPGSMECVPDGSVKRCRDTRCLTDTTCGCNPQYVITQGKPKEIYLQDIGGVGGVQTTMATSTATPRATLSPASNSNLPTAGTLEITLAMLLTGLSVAGIGFAWIRLR